MAECSLQEDLPLMSNVGDIHVRHYNFNFHCDFETKTFTCTALLFLEPVLHNLEFSKFDCCTFEKHLEEVAQNDQSNLGFVLILDCHKISVTEVTMLRTTPGCHQSTKVSSSLPNGDKELSFAVSDWSLKIWKNANTCKYCFPKVVSISYVTTPLCPSLLWVKDQNGNPSVFIHGAAINNRALFPCQEPPVAMATWEAVVAVKKGYVVLMSGDEEPLVSCADGLAYHYYNTKKVLPMSTLCLAIGIWREHLIPLKDKNGPKCRIFASSKLLDKTLQEFSEYIPQCLNSSQELLGPYPFPRIDFLVVPPTFSSLGMASPNIVFLSQSLLAGDRSLCSRLSHEVSHGWFGLSIGASDWTEEWLSEGFATFVEDILHAKATQMSRENTQNYIELKALIRKKVLMDEVENTQEELQVLRPSYGESNEHVVDGVTATVLKNGQNPLKSFIQVHYIKGYFLLKYLSDRVGIDNFLNFLKVYVKEYEGQLVTSKEFLTFFLGFFPSMSPSLSVEEIYANWLHNSGVNAEIRDLVPSSENQLFSEVAEETEKWKKFTLKKRGPKRRKPQLDHFSRQLTPDQTVLLLENLLGEELDSRTLSCLDGVFCFRSCNAEIQHRWFEMVLKHKYKCQYNALLDFFAQHMAMGVYLYGEVMYFGDEKLQKTVREFYLSFREEMEPTFRSTVDKIFSDSSGDGQDPQESEMLLALKT